MSATAIPLFRHDDPETSRAAARRVSSVAKSLEAQILDALAMRSLTDDSLCLALNIDPRRWPSCKTARSRLKKKGLVVSTGNIRNGQTIWCLKQNAPLVSPVKVVGDIL